MKAKLPRRESERVNHKLSRHFEILTSINKASFSILGSTFLRYIDSGRCCFIPGKVLDEILYIVGKLRAEENPPEPHEILKEVRELRDMAVEYFKEEIVPSLEIPGEVSSSSGFSFNHIPNTLSEPNKGDSRMENENKQILEMKNQIRNQNEIIQQQNTRIQQQNTRIQQQNSRIQQQGTRITEMENKWAEMNKRLAQVFSSF